MASSSDNWERLVQAVLKRDRAGVVGLASAAVTPSLTSTASIEHILQAADDIENDDINVARILCEQAHTMAQNLDPSSGAGIGVLQFRTGFTSVIKQNLATKDGASIDRRNDIEVLSNFYLEYKSRRRLDDMQREEQERMRESGTFSTEMGAGAVEMEKTYATLSALLDVLEIFVRQAPTDRLARQILEERSIFELNDSDVRGGDPIQLHEVMPEAEPVADGATREDPILGTKPSSTELRQEDIDPPLVESSNVAPSENWERLVRATLNRDQTGVVGLASAAVTPSLGSAANIEQILQAADDIEDNNINVARILCEQAYTMAQNLDPSSGAGRGVLQLKTGLTSVIKQNLATKDGASIDRRNDIEALWNFYLEYKTRRRFDDMQREQERMRESGTSSTEMGARAVEMEKIYATLRALLDVLKILVGQAPTDRLARQILEERNVFELNDSDVRGGDPTQLHEPPVEEVMPEAEPDGAAREDPILGTEPSSMELGQEGIDSPLVESSDVDPMQEHSLNEIYQNTTHDLEPDLTREALERQRSIKVEASPTKVELTEEQKACIEARASQSQPTAQTAT